MPKSQPPKSKKQPKSASKPKAVKVPLSKQERKDQLVASISKTAKAHPLPVLEGNKPYWTLDRGLSFSGFQLWLTCREQFRMRYIHGWRLVERKDSALVAGDMMHNLIEHRPDPADDKAILAVMAKCLGTPSDRPVLEAKIAALYKIYYPLYKLPTEDRIQAEHEFNYVYEFKYRGKPYSIRIKGFIDCLLNLPNNRLAIRETKTRTDMSVDNTTVALVADLQANSYFLAVEQQFGKFPDRLIYDLVKKPQHEWNSAKETLPEFRARVLEAIKAAPERFFHRIAYNRSLAEFNIWRQNILHPHLAEFLDWYRRLEDNNFKALKPYNPVALVGKYGLCDLFHLLVSGNTVGLLKKDSM